MLFINVLIQYVLVLFKEITGMWIMFLWFVGLLFLIHICRYCDLCLYNNKKKGSHYYNVLFLMMKKPSFSFVSSLSRHITLDTHPFTKNTNPPLNFTKKKPTKKTSQPFTPLKLWLLPSLMFLWMHESIRMYVYPNS